MQKNKNKIFLSVIAICFCLVEMCACSNEEATEITDLETATVIQYEETGGDIYVYITGQVKKPGVYQVSEGTRLFKVVELAGGMTDKAQKNYLNLAETVADGQQVQVLSKKQYKKLIKSGTVPGDNKGTSFDDLININQATAEELTTLSGIGDSKAKAIVEYREKNGMFSTIEDLKNVNGIGEATFENIKSQITV